MDEKKVLDRLQRLCSRAEYCSADVTRKALRSLEGDSAAAGRVVAALVRERYVDDARYASAFARDKASLQGWGPVKIRYALRAKGITGDVAEEAIREACGVSSADDRMEKLLAAKARSLLSADGKDPATRARNSQSSPSTRARNTQDSSAIRVKLLRYALGRGYTYEQAAPVIEKILG